MSDTNIEAQVQIPTPSIINELREGIEETLRMLDETETKALVEAESILSRAIDPSVRQMREAFDKAFGRSNVLSREDFLRSRPRRGLMSAPLRKVFAR